MPKMEPQFVLIFILVLLIGIFYAYAYIKEKKLYYLISALLLLLIPCLVGIGMWQNSEELVEVGFVSPFGLFLVATFAELLLRYKRCNCVVTATYVSAHRMPGRRWFRSYAPRFSYTYRGETFEVNSFVSYSERKFFRRYARGYTYDICIDPKDPRHCVDKWCFPVGSVVGVIVSIMFCVFGTWIALI